MSSPIWLVHALKDNGLREVRGGENPRIIEMDSYTTLKAKEDEIAWCSAALCCWFEEVHISSTKSAAAISWATWGKGLDEPKEGCVCVVRHKKSGNDKATGSTSGYHVALWLGQDRDYVYLFGGNQSDSVKKSSFPLKDYEIVALRWPEGF